MLMRIICKDGLKYTGLKDKKSSNLYKLYLKGHMHHIWYRNITDIFILTHDIWKRTRGPVTLYDTYIKNGGDVWPDEFFDIIYSNDL
jgi:hypothetical protein